MHNGWLDYRRYLLVVLLYCVWGVAPADAQCPSAPRIQCAGILHGLCPDEGSAYAACNATLPGVVAQYQCAGISSGFHCETDGHYKVTLIRTHSTGTNGHMDWTFSNPCGSRPTKESGGDACPDGTTDGACFVCDDGCLLQQIPVIGICASSDNCNSWFEDVPTGLTCTDGDPSAPGAAPDAAPPYEPGPRDDPPCIEQNGMIVCKTPDGVCASDAASTVCTGDPPPGSGCGPWGCIGWGNPPPIEPGHTGPPDISGTTRGPEGEQDWERRPPDFCEKNPGHPRCSEPDFCDKFPQHDYCQEPSFCDRNPQHINCQERPETPCEADPEHPACVKNWCEKNADHPACQDPDTFCAANPSHPGCYEEGEWCTQHPDHPMCGNFCLQNPTSPLCQDFCDANPGNLMCGDFCEQKPDHPICNENGDFCAQNPRDPACNWCVVNPTDPACDDLDDMCESRPELPQCAGNVAGGGETCLSRPTCSGDFIQCAILQQNWETRCQMEQFRDIFVWDDIDPEPGGDPATLHEEIAVDSSILDTSGFLGAGGCPNISIPLDFFGHHSNALDSVPWCNFIGWLGWLVVASATVTAFRIIGGT